MVYLVDHKLLYASNIPLTNKTFQPFYIRITCGDTIRLLAAALETMKCNGTCSKHNKKKKTTEYSTSNCAAMCYCIVFRNSNLLY